MVDKWSIKPSLAEEMVDILHFFRRTFLLWLSPLRRIASFPKEIARLLWLTLAIWFAFPAKTVPKCADFSFRTGNDEKF